MGKRLAQLLRSMADSCEEGARPDKQFEQMMRQGLINEDDLQPIKNDIQDMKALIGYLGKRIQAMEIAASENSDKIIPFIPKGK